MKKEKNSRLITFSIKQIFIFLSSLIKNSHISKYKEMKEQYFTIEKTLLKIEHKYLMISKKLSSIEKKLFVSSLLNIGLLIYIIFILI